MTFQQALSLFPSLKSLYSLMNLNTSMGRKLLLSTEFSTSKAWIEQQWEQSEECERFIATQNEQSLHRFYCLMGEICDIGGTLSLIENSLAADDVGLYELKVFCINVMKLKKQFATSLMPLPDLDEAIAVLDPEGLRLPSFYVYSAYSEALAAKRNEWENSKNGDDEQHTHNLYVECLELEEQVRQILCQKLFVHIPKLKQALSTVAKIDLSFARAELTQALKLSRVEITETKQLSYRQMFHPVVKKLMTEKGKRYQDIDIDAGEEVLLITGANMAGKTLILKTLATNQLLLQFGFKSACTSGTVCLFDSVQCSIGDGQNEEEGLSSFAYEIKTLDNIIKTMRSGGRHLVLADELARTTNPTEGRKLVEGFIGVCSEQNSLAVVTTHYSDIRSKCKKVRVKGFNHHNLTPPIDIETISEHIDYSLVETDSSQAPTEALNLCRLLAVDGRWIELAEQ